MMNPADDEPLIRSSSMQPAKLVNCDCSEAKENSEDEESGRREKTNGVVDANNMYNSYLVQNDNNSYPTVFVITPTYFR